MKKILFFCMICCGVLQVAAQQKPYYTQYILNNYILNPALSGIESYTDVKLSYRNQWTGIDGAPVTTYLSIQGPLGHSDQVRSTPTSFERGGVNMTGKNSWDNYTAPDQHSGAGLIVMNDKTGYLSRVSVYGSYAFHKPLNERTALAIGFMAGFTSVSLDRSKIIWEEGVPEADLAIGYDGGDLKKFMPELGAGLWLYSKNYYLGLSALNIIPGKAKFVAAGKYGESFTPHYFASAGYRFAAGNGYTVLPSVTVQSISPVPLQVHVNIKLQFEDLVWVGGSYRISDQLGGFAGMAGINISHTFNIGYSYDAATSSRLKKYAGDTHEIIIGFLLNNKYGDSCPRNVW